eukprot:13700497-Heterocapsa_arctica.AAC.1
MVGARNGKGDGGSGKRKGRGKKTKEDRTEEERQEQAHQENTCATSHRHDKKEGGVEKGQG